MTNLKHDIFNSGVVVSTPATTSGRGRSSHFCNAPLETPGKSGYGRSRQRQLTSDIVVTQIEVADHHEDGCRHESEEPGFATHLDGGFMGFEAAADYEQILDKWCRIQM